MYSLIKHSSQIVGNGYSYRLHFGDDHMSLEETKQVTQALQLTSAFRGNCLLSDEETEVQEMMGMGNGLPGMPGSQVET